MSRPAPWTFAKLSVLYGAIVLTLMACKPEETTPPFEGPPVTAPVVVDVPAQTGFWADDPAVCVKPGPLPKTMLHWDVSDQTIDDVVVYVVDKSSKHPEERNFSRGGPKDQHKTGPWLKPGLEFKLREDGTGKELGTITITEKPC